MGGKTSTSSQTVSIPPEVLARYNAVNARAENVAATPFQPYSGEFVAPLSPTQQAGVQATSQYSQSAQPYYGAATGLTLAGAQDVGPLTGGQIGYYMNPFLSSVAQPTIAALRQQQGQDLARQQAEAIRSGAFGGDRAGIQRAVLQGQQELATGQAVAPIFAQGYQQAVQTAQGQQGVVAADLARRMQAAQQIAGLGTGAQAAALQGAQAQIGAGTLEQQTQQALDTAKYQQFLQERGYPFQVAQFLANIAMGTGALSGSTTTTTQQQPFFSDRRLKTDIKEIGKTKDGLPIYSFKYKGSKQTHIGLMAQDVEKKKPEAVGLAAGFKTVDYEKATEGSERRHRDAGGLVVDNSMGGAVTPMNIGEAFARGGYALRGSVDDPSAIQPIGFGGYTGTSSDMSAILNQMRSFQGQPFAKAGLYSGSPQSNPMGQSYVPPASLATPSLLKAGPLPAQQPSGFRQAVSFGRDVSDIGAAAGKAKDWWSGYDVRNDQTGETRHVAGAWDKLKGLGAGSDAKPDTPPTPPADIPQKPSEYGLFARGGLVPRHAYATDGSVLPYDEDKKDFDYFPKEVLDTASKVPDNLKPGGGGGPSAGPSGFSNLAGLVGFGNAAFQLGSKVAPMLSSAATGAGSFLSAIPGFFGIPLASGGVAGHYATRGTVVDDPDAPTPDILPSQSMTLGDAGRAAPARQTRVASNDDSLFGSLLQQESGGRQFARSGDVLTSPKGAIGVSQIMPATAPEAARLAGEDFDPVRLRTDAAYNQRLGRAYFDEQVRQFGDPLVAAAAYNAGPARVRQAMNRADQNGGSYIDYLPRETQRYVQALTHAAAGAISNMGSTRYAQAASPTASDATVPGPAIEEPRADSAAATVATATPPQQTRESPPAAGVAGGAPSAPAQQAGVVGRPVFQNVGSWERVGSSVLPDWMPKDSEFWVPLIAGVGSMLASQSKSLPGAIGEGLVGASAAYKGIRESNQQVAESQAREAVQRGTAAKSSILFDQTTGLPTFVIVTGPTGQSQLINFGEAYKNRGTLNLQPATLREMEDLARRYPKAVSEAAAAAPAAAPGVAGTPAKPTTPAPAAAAGPTPRPAAPAAPAPAAAATRPTQAPLFGFSPDEKKQLQARIQDWIASPQDVANPYFANLNEEANFAADQKRLLLPLAKSLASLPKGESVDVSGPLQEFINPIRARLVQIASMFGNENLVNEASVVNLANQDDVRKLVGQLTAQRTSEAGMRAASAYKDFMLQIPNLLQNPASQGKVLANILVAAHTPIDKQEHAQNFIDAASGGDSYLRTQALRAGAEAQRDFNNKYGQTFYQGDRDILEDLFNKKVADPSSPNGYTTGMAKLLSATEPLSDKTKQSLVTMYGPNVLRTLRILGVK